MTDPREVLGGGFPSRREELDLDAVHRRTAQLRRRRRAAGAVAAAAVLVGGAGAASQVLGGGDEDPSSYVAAVPTESARQTPERTPGTPRPTPTPPPDTEPTGGPSAGDDPPISTPATTPATAAPPEPEPPTPTSAGTPDPPAAPFYADTSPDEAEAVGAGLIVTSVRTGRQDGYDRVVYELAGPADAAAGWRAGYVDAAIADGSGQEVEVQGQAILQVVLTGLGIEPVEGATVYTGVQRPNGTRVVREVSTGGVFEGTAQSFVGLDFEAPFRVFRLDDPPRVVVDVLAE